MDKDPYKWRRANLDMYREQQKIYQRKTYKDYYDTVRKEQKKIYYQYKKTVKGMMAMMDNLVQSTVSADGLISLKEPFGGDTPTDGSLGG